MYHGGPTRQTSTVKSKLIPRSTIWKPLNHMSKHWRCEPIQPAHNTRSPPILASHFLTHTMFLDSRQSRSHQWLLTRLSNICLACKSHFSNKRAIQIMIPTEQHSNPCRSLFRAWVERWLTLTGTFNETFLRDRRYREWPNPEFSSARVALIQTLA